MNARFLEKLIVYREKYQILFCKTMISQKIEHQFAILNKRYKFIKYEKDINDALKIESILLIEARAAREYWSLFGKLISTGEKLNWNGRKAHSGDVINNLLDIGYHYLTQKVTSIFEKLEVPTELGFFHKAQGKKSRPLVYDFIEWLRPFVVDEILLKFVAKKKKPIYDLDSRIISYFIFKIKQEFGQKYYHQKLGYCIKLDYWIELCVLTFIKAVNENKKYSPRFPSLRHESRCKVCKIKPLESKLETV